LLALGDGDSAAIFRRAIRNGGGGVADFLAAASAMVARAAASCPHRRHPRLRKTEVDRTGRYPGQHRRNRGNSV